MSHISDSPALGKVSRGKWMRGQLWETLTWVGWAHACVLSWVEFMCNKASEELPPLRSPPSWGSSGNSAQEWKVGFAPVQQSQARLLSARGNDFNARAKSWVLNKDKKENSLQTFTSLFRKVRFKTNHKPGTLPWDCTAFSWPHM